MRTEGRGDKVEGRREKDKLRRSRKDFAGDERTLLENKRTTLSLGGGGGEGKKSLGDLFRKVVAHFSLKAKFEIRGGVVCIFSKEICTLSFPTIKLSNFPFFVQSSNQRT